MGLFQRLNGSAAALLEYSKNVPVIDTHEHIPGSEKAYNERVIRFGDLFNPYVSNDLNSAGMRFPEGSKPAFYCIGDDWDAFEPYWQVCKHGSYARALRIALKEFYGVDDFSRDNYLEIVAKINERNTPGIYTRVLREACGIERAVRCADDLPAPDDSILVGNIASPSRRVSCMAHMERMCEDVEASEIKCLDELIEVSGRWMEMQVSLGAMEFKSMAVPVEIPDRTAAEEVLGQVLSGEVLSEADASPLIAYVREADARKAAELDVPLALHTGVWEDYRQLDVNHLVGFVKRNPKTRMDIYHLGIPEVRSAVQVVKNFPNAYLNLCWAHIVAPDMVVNTMKEAMDLVPLNKVFAFGGDYILFIEKVYGHLHMARENIALILGDRVDRDLMDLSDAEQVLRAWFYDNPKTFYRL